MRFVHRFFCLGFFFFFLFKIEADNNGLSKIVTALL